MGKKSTTNVDTGLGDKQYETLAGNQASIASSIDTASAAATEGMNNLSAGQDTITENQAKLSAQNTALNKGQGVIVGNQDALKTGQTGLAATQKEILSAVKSAPSVDLSGVTSSINSLKGTTDAGFNKMTGRFDSVDSQLDTIGTGVTGLGTQMDGLETSVEGLGTQVEGLGTQVDEGFDAAQADREAMSELLSTGQASMTDLINKYGENAATYYADLAGNQDIMMENQAGLQTGLTAFQDTYNQNFDMEAKRFGELQDQVTSGLGDVAGAQAQMADSVSGMTTQLADRPAASQAVAPAAQQAAPQIDYARIAKEVATGVNTNSQESFNNSNMFASKLDNIRSILADQGNNLDAGLKQQYTRLSNSFDQNGKLISKQVDSNGNTLARAIDQNGNLLLAAFDQSGTQISRDSLDMNGLMSMFDQIMQGQQRFTQQMQMGGNYKMGNLSPAYNRGLGGLASPFSRTRRRDD